MRKWFETWLARLTEWIREFIPQMGWCISEWAICDFKWGDGWWARNNVSLCGLVSKYTIPQSIYTCIYIINIPHLFYHITDENSPYKIYQCTVMELNFCRAMLCISAAYAVMRCLSVCLSVTFVDSAKRSNRIIKFFSPSGSHANDTILLLHTKRHGNIPAGTPLTGALNATRVGRNRVSEPIAGFTACCELFHRQVQYT